MAYSYKKIALNIIYYTSGTDIHIPMDACDTNIYTSAAQDEICPAFLLTYYLQHLALGK